MKNRIVDAENIGFDLVGTIDTFVDFVQRKGPRETCFGHGNWREYFAELGPDLTTEDMAVIVGLDSHLKLCCNQLAIEIPPKREEDVGPYEVAFGYTGLIIHNLTFAFEQPYMSITLRPTPDWKFRMDSLRKLAVKHAGIAGPRWRKEAKELLFDGRRIYKYKKNPAKNHKTILDAFEAAKWIRIIPNPFEQVRNCPDPKGVLDDTVRSMKSIPQVRFSRAGDNEVAWDEIPLNRNP